MNTVGLDISLSSPGIVVWNGDRVLRARNPKSTPKTGSEGVRYKLVLREVLRAVRKAEPVLVAIERNAHMSKFKDDRNVELNGIVKWELARRDVPYTLVAPNTLKLFATGNGRASKSEMLAAARLIYSKCPNDDVADALHLARYAYEHYDSDDEELE